MVAALAAAALACLYAPRPAAAAPEAPARATSARTGTVPAARTAPAARPAAGIAGDPAAAAAFMEKGDQAAADGRVTDALDAWQRAYERLFPSFRGLGFKSPVRAEYLDRSGLRQHIIEVLAREMPDAEMLAEQKTMAVFGFVAPGFDLKETSLRLHTEQVAGFYDPEKKRLFLIREGDAAAGFDPGQYKMTLAHEMAHALMDQHYNLLAMQRAVEKDDDRSLALAGLIEGEATLAMLAAMDPERSAFFLRLPPALLDLAMTLLKPFLAFASGPAFRDAPGILKESMLFPYLKGLPFCLGLTGKTATWDAVDAAFGQPPVSTEQVLHPARYPKDAPTTLVLPDIAPDLGEGWSPVSTNVVGELPIRILLAGALPVLDAERAAEGWGGDRYRVYQKPVAGDGKAPTQLLLAWASTWDTQEDARQFREAYARFLAGRVGQEPQDGSEVADFPQGVWGRAWLAHDCRIAVIGRGPDVWVLTGIPEPAFAAVATRVMQVTRKPKTPAKSGP